MSQFDRKYQELLADIRRLPLIQCGEEAAQHFAFEDGYRNLNHGSYGTYPISVRNVFRHYQERSESVPDIFVRWEYRTDLLNEARAVVAKYLHAPVETCVFMFNASAGIDTILHNLQYEPGDVIICFAEVYESFENTIRYLSERTPVQIEKIQYLQPVSDDYVCRAFEDKVNELRSRGKNPRLALFDTVSSLPGTRMPFERLIELCRAHKVLSCVDGAHGIGLLPLDLERLNPDFFVSNCHKWLYVPRGCAVFYVPTRNQDLLRMTFPTGFSWVPKEQGGGQKNFVANFASIGTKDDTPYLCVAAALEWRARLEWQGKKGEQAVMGYLTDLAHRGGEIVSSILGTQILENEGKSLNQNSFTNVRLPLPNAKEWIEGDPTVPTQIVAWIMKTMALEHRIALCGFFHAGEWWVRLSAQVYLTLEDFEITGRKLKEVCERLEQGGRKLLK